MSSTVTQRLDFAPAAPGSAAEIAARPALDPAFVARFLAGMSPQVAARFDARQLFAVQQAFGRRGARERRRGWHWRIRLPWAGGGGGRHYLLSFAPIEEEMPADHRAAARCAATWRGLALGVAAAAALLAVLAATAAAVAA